MDSKSRLMTSWSNQEPDRVPIELQISPAVKDLPEARRIVEFIDTQADNFLGVPGADWGFVGLPTEYREEVIEEVPGQFKRVKRIHRTSAGEFHAITLHPAEDVYSGDFHWERRFIDTIEDLDRLASAARKPSPLQKAQHDEAVERIGGRGVPVVGVLHPLGWLVRNANMEAAYGWFVVEPDIMHKFLDRTNRHVAETVAAMGDSGIGPIYAVCAHEMLLPPWMGRDLFEEFVFPYDKRVNDAVHAVGGKMRAHCHGNCMEFLDRMCEMGLDSIEPLESPPYGDVILEKAKKVVDGRMLLSGNILSQCFVNMTPKEVRDAVKEAIRVGAPGGGFTLRPTGGEAGTGSGDRAQVLRVLQCVQAYIDAALEFGRYPARV